MARDAFPLCFIAFLVIIGIFVAIASISSAVNKGVLEQVAKRWKGYVELGGFFGYDGLVMQIGDAYARLSYSKRGKNSRNTHLSVHFPDKQLRLELYVQDVIQQLKKLLGMYDLEIGAREFDDAFIINGNQPERIIEYLNPQSQVAILKLARFSTLVSNDLHLTISGGVLRVTKHRGFQSVGELNEFITLFSEVFEALAYSRNTGIEFVSSSPLPRVQETECQVCGHPLEGKIVFCLSCKTPHHLDCWNYFESCAVYGCGQHRYTEARRA
ncbi:RING finger protein [Anatilimnocola floriformis]|uniref:RING finger protein n=1 Tax=Anatilimnocola floriformis TaxID=2948575 RepID=UPI0020C358C3|nr:RING finger protein [Anatilimnocola floriformis]